MERFARFVQEHWVGFLVGGIAAALSLFATLWQVFTHDTVPEVWARQGIVIEWLRIVAVVAALLLASGFFAFASSIRKLSRRPVIHVGGGVVPPPPVPPQEMVDKLIAQKSAPAPGPLKLIVQQPPPPPPTQLQPAPVPDSHFTIKLRLKKDHYFIWLRNEEDDEKKDYAIWVVGAEYYSPDLQKGQGGYVRWREVGLYQLKEPDRPNSLLYDNPKWFEFIRVRERALVALTKNAVFQLRPTRHRFAVEFRWKTYVSKYTIELDVKDVEGRTEIEVLSASTIDQA